MPKSPNGGAADAAAKQDAAPEPDEVAAEAEASPAEAAADEATAEAAQDPVEQKYPTPAEVATVEAETAAAKIKAHPHAKVFPNLAAVALRYAWSFERFQEAAKRRLAERAASTAA